MKNTADKTENQQTASPYLSDSHGSSKDIYLHQILNRLHAGVTETTLDGRFLTMNDRYCEIVGYSREELLSKTLMEITHPDDLPANIALLQTAIDTNSSFHIEKRYVKKDGSIIWVNNSVGIIDNPKHGRVTMAVCIDITDRKRAEKELKDSEERYQNFIRRSTEGIWRCELDKPIKVDMPVQEQVDYIYDHGYMAECNDAMAKMYGYGKAEDLANLPLNKFFPRDADTEAYLTYFIESNYSADGIESKELDKDGNIRYFINNLVGIVENGQLLCAWGSQRDVTQQKTIEEALRVSNETSEKRKRLYETIANSTPDLIYVFDLDYHFTYANKALLTMLGRTWDSVVGKTLRECGYEEWHADMHEREIDRVVATKKPIRGVVSFPHADLGKRVYDYIFAPVMNGEGNVEAVAGTTRDITDIQLAEESLRENEERYRKLAESLEHIVIERTRELQRSNEDLQQFAHVASHDLKEPVRKLRMFSGRLREEYGTEMPVKALQHVEKIEKAADRMYSMIDGMLTYSWFNAMEQRYEDVDLNKLISDIESDLELVIAAKKATISYSGLPHVKGSPILIHQLFYNLINNSLKFSRNDVLPRIKIYVAPEVKTTEGSDTVTLVLEDNGIGFTAGDAENIFNPFTRLHTRDKYEGTGLGLALCRNIAERHGGSIRAEGRLGEGARFLIALVRGEVKGER